MCRVAKEHDAVAVAHGCTGKGNDQVRFDAPTQTRPHLKIIALAGARVEMDPNPGAANSGPTTGSRSRRPRRASPAPTRTSRAARSRPEILEDPWVRALRPKPSSGLPSPATLPDEGPRKSRIRIRSRPANHPQRPDPRRGRADRGAEQDRWPPWCPKPDRPSRTGSSASSRVRIYEAPAAIVLHEAHREIEFLTLSKDALRFKTYVSQHYCRSDL